MEDKRSTFSIRICIIALLISAVCLVFVLYNFNANLALEKQTETNRNMDTVEKIEDRIISKVESLSKETKIESWTYDQSLGVLKVNIPIDGKSQILVYEWDYYNSEWKDSDNIILTKYY